MSRRAFGSVRKLASGRWQARYTGPDLIEHKAPSTFTFKRDAESWLAAEDRLIAGGVWVAPAKRQAKASAASVTVGEYVERIIQRRASRSRKPLARPRPWICTGRTSAWRSRSLSVEFGWSI